MSEWKWVKVASGSLRPHGLYSPWNSPGQNTVLSLQNTSLSLLQGIFPTQGSNSGLPHCRRILYQLSYQGSPVYSYKYKKGKDCDAGKDWGQEEKGVARDKMVGWHHWLNGHEFEQAPGACEGQVCCSLWNRKELDATWRLNTVSNKIEERQRGRLVIF